MTDVPRWKSRLTKEQEEAYIATADRLWSQDGLVEVDTDAVVSVCEEGAYVQAWVWVPNSELTKEEGQ